MAEETVFGPYQLVERIGQGGMGEVWRAHDSRRDRDVALKVLKSGFRDEPGYEARFRREIKLAARLNHPHIIPFHDYGEIDDHLYIDMPLIDGPNLGELIQREGPLPPTRAVGIIDQIADALDAAHEAGLVHRDVKPSNVLMLTRRDDFAYLIDFGIAGVADMSRITLSREVAGTLLYMAPERFDGKGDHRSDVYALACVLYETLTQEPPFIRDGFGPLLKAHTVDQPPSASQLNPAVPLGMDEVIARGMAKEPDERYSSAGELAAAASAVLANTKLDDQEREDDAKLARKIRVAAPPAPTDIRPPRSTARPTPPTLRAKIAPTELFDPSPPASRPAGSTPPKRSSRGVLIVFWALMLSAVVFVTVLVWSTTRIPTPNILRTLTGHVFAVNSVANAQLDGRPVVISGSWDFTVRVWDLATGQPVGAPFTGHAAYGVDSVTTAQLNGRPVVVSGNDDTTVRLSDLATGQPVGNPFSGHSLSVTSVATTQLNGRPVVISGDNDKTVRVWDLATGQPVGAPFGGHTGGVKSVATAQLNGRGVVISGGDDGMLLESDLETGQPIDAKLSGDALGNVTSVATAQLNGHPVVISGGSAGVRVQDLATGQPIGTPFRGHAYTVASVAATQLNGRPVVISCDRDTVRVWDLASGQAIGATFGHIGTINAVTAAQLNGRTIVVVGTGDPLGKEDAKVLTWDLAAQASS